MFKVQENCKQLDKSFLIKHIRNSAVAIPVIPNDYRQEQFIVYPQSVLVIFLIANVKLNRTQPNPFHCVFSSKRLFKERKYTYIQWNTFIIKTKNFTWNLSR